MPNLLFVMLGGAIGAGLRFAASGMAANVFGRGFPWGTWSVNLLGGLLMGLLAGMRPSEPLLLFLGVGILGGFTTFSAFSLETAQMLERGDLVLAAVYAASSVLISVVLLFAGLWIARAAA